MTTMLAPNFSLVELTRTTTGLDNTPNETEIQALTALARGCLQPIRDGLGKPIIVVSGFRSAAVNRAVAGSAQSQHRQGEAADVRVTGVTSRQLARWIVDQPSLIWDQLIWYDAPDRHVHISYVSDRPNRREVRYASPDLSYPKKNP